MKKLISLVLVMILLVTSVFTGFAVSASEIIIETSWEEDYGIKVDESIYPGYYLGADYRIWDTNNPKYATARSSEEGIKFYKLDNNGKFYTFRDTVYHRKYAPSIAIDAGRTGGKGDNALIFGMPIAYSEGYILFNNRNANGGIVCGTGTWNISFDIKLVAGEVGKVYSNFRLYAPGIGDIDADCENSTSTSINSYGTTEGYGSSDISANKWTTLAYTASINGATNSFYINIEAPSENGAIVLIDNIKICDASGTNYLVGDKFRPIITNSATISPYNEAYTNGDTLYINNEFGNFNASTYSDETGWSQYGLFVDQEIVPGYYLNNDPYCFSEDATEKSRPGNDGAPYLWAGGSWYGDVATRRKWAPAVAVGAGKTGMSNDNALVFGMPVATAQTSIVFYVRDDDSNIIFKNDVQYQISFDIKSIAGNCKGIYSTLIINKPAPNKDSKYTCLHDITVDGEVLTQKTYNNKYDEETGIYGTDGYSQADISTTDWTTLTFNVTPVDECNWFYINLVPADSTGAVVLVDNIVIQDSNGENLFVDDNVQFTSSTSSYKDKYSAVQHYLGTFDYADPKAVKNTIDERITYIPVNSIGDYDVWNSYLDPTLSEAGEGVNGSYAINLGVNQNRINMLTFRGYNPNAVDTIHPNDNYLFEFKARVKSGVVDKLDVGIATNDYTATAKPYHNMQIFNSATGTNDKGESTYTYKSYTQNYLRVAGSQLSDEWQTFRFYATTNCYENAYKHLRFTLYGADTDVVIQLDDIKGYTVADGELTPIYVWAAGDPNGSSFDLAKVSAYDVTASETDGYIVTVPASGVTAAEFIDNMNLNADLEYGYRNNKEIYCNDALITEDSAIGTGYILKLVGNGKSGQYNGVYESFTIAVKNDINGDTAVDARDIVRAKKISAGTETATVAQLAAANATDEIRIEDVAAIRNSLIG